MDAQWDEAKMTYRKYDLTKTGWTDQGLEADKFDTVIDLCDNTDDTRQLKGQAELTWLPAWQGVTYEYLFKKNKSILPVFANKSGKFYYGDHTQALEYTRPYIGNVTTLRHWNHITPGVVPYNENSGVLGFWSVGTNTDIPLETVSVVLDNNFISKVRVFKLHFNIGIAFSGAGLPLTSNARFVVKLDDGAGTVRYMKWNQTTEVIEWITAFHTFDYPVPTRERSISASFTIPIPDEFLTQTTLTFQINNIYSFRTLFEDYNTYYDYLVLEYEYPEWENAGYEYSPTGIFAPVIINQDGELPPQKFEYSWGIVHPTLPNENIYHLSSPYDDTGVVITDWRNAAEGTADDKLFNWLMITHDTDNRTPTRVLNIKLKTTDITPFTIIKDFEGKYYQLVSGEWNDKYDEWSCQYIEFKALKGLTLPTLGEYSDDYNDDYYN
jgi:hypothetical protein